MNKKTIAYIAHPIGGNVNKNLNLIRLICWQINHREPNIIPFVPYLADCGTLDDSKPEERKRGMDNNKTYFERKVMDEVRLYGTHISPGMKEEIKLAEKYGITITDCLSKDKIS